MGTNKTTMTAAELAARDEPEGSKKEPHPLLSVVAKNVGLRIKHQQVSLRYLASKAGCSLSTVQRLLSGSTSAQVDTLAKIADVLNVHPAALFIDGFDPDNPPVLVNRAAVLELRQTFRK